MVLSMTGFACKTVEIPVTPTNKAHLLLSLKSLNSRFFEAACKLPGFIQPFEIDFVKLLKDHIVRGKITFAIVLSNPALFKGPVEPSLHMVQNYLDALEQIQKKYSIPGTLTISDLLALPNIFIEEEATLDSTFQTILFEEVSQLIKQLLQEQRKEGQALHNDLNERIVILKNEINQIELLAHDVIENFKLDIAKQLAELEGSSAEIIETTRHQLYYELKRMAIHEEIVRFKSHLISLSDFLVTPQIEKGRKIDFICQELMREINTICAKCTEASISSRAITIKVELEKIREQAQNIV